MDKQNALQDISYIRSMMQQTQEILDIAWPIYIYWGIFFAWMNIARIIFPYEAYAAMETAPPTLMISETINTILCWVGFFFTAIYIFRHRHKMLDRKMFLIGMLGLSFLLIYLTLNICENIIFIGNDNFQPHPAGDLNILLHGLFFASFFIVFGLVYAREQLWSGYSILLVTIFAVYMNVHTVSTQYALSLHIVSMVAGISFLIAGVMAYNRHRQQVGNG